MVMDGYEYEVDFGARKFKTTVNAAGRRDVVGFETAKGRRMWEELMILTCRRCGVVAVESRHMDGVRCENCGGWLLM